MEFNEFFEKQIEIMEKYNAKARAEAEDPKKMAKTILEMTSKMKANLDAYEKGGNK